MDFWKSMSGILTIKITSAVPELTLDSLTKAHIPLAHVEEINELTYKIQIYRTDYRKLSRILKRRGDQLQILQRAGIFWMLKSLSRRPLILLTLTLLFLSSLILPSRILFISVEGNRRLPDRMILSAAEECGIHFGASRKLVRSEKVKNALLSSVPQLQWVGVNTSGCTAVISVRERMEEESCSDPYEVSNLIADRDGYILSALITGGTPLVAPGDTVIQGQLLVSGYTDCGMIIRATRAEGEIVAQTNREITAIMPAEYTFAATDSEILYQFSMILGKKRINLWKDSRISDTGCGRMYEEYFVSLPGGFQLPMAFCVDRYISYDLQQSVLPETDAQNQLQIFSESYLLGQMVAGRILQKQHRLTFSGGLYKLKSNYVCTETIGREQREQIGVINGKRN